MSGAVCSNDITPRALSPTIEFPDIQGYELPAFIVDSKYILPTTGKPFFTGNQESTAYAVFIGTNDLGKSYSIRLWEKTPKVRLGIGGSMANFS